MNSKALYCLAVLGQLLSLLPFCTAAEGAIFGSFAVWRYLVYFAVFGGFYAVGRIAGTWASGSGFTSKQRGWALFASRAGVCVPAVIFIIVCVSAGFSTGLYLYIFPASIIAYFGGHHTVGMGYSDVFSRVWFALYFVTAMLCSGIMWFTYDAKIKSAAVFQLCFFFGVLIVLAAVLTNQTNIDSRTAQRCSGRSVLPIGLRGYNACLIAAVCALTVGLFLFAKPLAQVVGGLVKEILRLFLELLRGNENAELNNEPEFSNENERIDYIQGDGLIYQLLQILLIAGIVVVVIRFRREIWGFIKELFAPLFRESVLAEETPFVDEISEALTKSSSERSRRKTEQQLLKRYKKEHDPTLKYRIGYALFLSRLRKTPFPNLPSDTTSIHTKKGESAFRRSDLDGMVSVYNEVRYGGRIPTEKELFEQETLLDEIR